MPTLQQVAVGREDRLVMFTCRIPASLHREVKMEAVKRSSSVQEIASAALVQFLKQAKKKEAR